MARGVAVVDVDCAPRCAVLAGAASKHNVLEHQGLCDKEQVEYKHDTSELLQRESNWREGAIV